MPRVKSSVARKDYPREGIKKGDTYYSWAHFRQPVQRSKTFPTKSQLDNTKMSGAYAAEEALETAIASATCLDDLLSAIDECADSIEEVQTEYEDSLSNLEDAFPGGSPTIDDHNEKRDALETYAQALRDASTEIGQLDMSDYIDQELEVDGKVGDARNMATFDDLSPDEQQEALAAAKDIINEVSLDV